MLFNFLFRLNLCELFVFSIKGLVHVIKLVKTLALVLAGVLRLATFHPKIGTLAIKALVGS
jgi:hypothetical protein